MRKNGLRLMSIMVRLGGNWALIQIKRTSRDGSDGI